MRFYLAMLGFFMFCLAGNGRAMTMTGVRLIYKTGAAGAVCLDGVMLNFDAGVFVPSLWGQVNLISDMGLVRALVPKDGEVALWSREVFMALESPQICRGERNLKWLEVRREIRNAEGHAVDEYRRFALAWPSAAETVSQLEPEEVASQVQGEPSSNACKSEFCGFRVTREALQKANRAVSAWRKAHATDQGFQYSGLRLLELGNGLRPDSAINRTRQYANADVQYLLTSASVFMGSLGYGLISVADVSAQDGKTPSIRGSSGNLLYLHPEGSHTAGKDADLAYYWRSKGELDLEANFWLLYAVLRYSGVDLVLTAYTDQLRSMAREAFQAHLINEVAWARFDSNRLQLNTDYNHDQHLHLSILNTDNRGESRRFKLSDNAYCCYVKLRPKNLGVNANFCSDPF